MGNEFHRYLIAGVFNTAVGYIAFLVALRVFGMNPAVSNGISYAIGLLSAYIINALFVFRAARHSRRTLLRFMAGFCVAYAINFAVLHIMIEGAALRAEFAQVFAMAAYTVAFYLINKHFVWKI